MTKTFKAVDLFCGAGGTSHGVIQSFDKQGLGLDLTAINHNEKAIATHSHNHPRVRHFCEPIELLNPRKMYGDDGIDALYASPECTNHSYAKGNREINDQSRCTAHRVVEWADALRPREIMVENVVAFKDWGPLHASGPNKGRAIKERKGEIFKAWISMLEALGYTVEWEVMNAANFGAPTTRERLIVRASLTGKVNWPRHTHASGGAGGLIPWKSAQDHVIDWDIESRSIWAPGRKLLSPNTLARIEKGLIAYGLEPFVVTLRNNAWARPASLPLTTIATSGAHHAIAQAVLIPQHSGGAARSTTRPVPTVAAAGAIGVASPFLTIYNGTSSFNRLDKPLATVTTNDRFCLTAPTLTKGGDRVMLDIQYRMLKSKELARAQDFPEDFAFVGNDKEVKRQIGNAVPPGLAEAVTDYMF